MRRWLSLIFFLLLVLVVRGQVVTGIVVNEDDVAISKASVYLKDGKRIVAFSFTDEQGSFSVDSKDKAFSEIELRKVGYAIKNIPRSEYKNGQKTVLAEKAMELKEVTVKSQKIRQEGDTLNYLVGSFIGKQDRSIADVIKKMPGLSVNNDGTIEYQGRRINKFYIEGMDLLGAKYAQASENLDARKVKKVQVLERHQPVKALKNINFSDQAALNIVLSDSAKNVWSHVVGLSTGTTLEHHPDWLYDARLMSMLFSRSLQSVSMYKANNTGKDIAREIAPSGYLSDTAPTDDGILNNISLPAPDIDTQRSSFNTSHLFATNWLKKTKGGNDLRLQLDGILDKASQQHYSSVAYTAADNKTIVQEESARGHHNALSAEILYKQNTDHQYLTNNLSGYIDFDYSKGQSLINGIVTKEDVRPRQRYVSDKLSFVRNIGGHSISANAYFSLNNLPGSLLLADSTMEQLGKKSLLGGTDIHYGQKIGKIFLNYTFGTDFKYQRLQISHTVVDEKRDYHEWRSYLKTSASYKLQLLELKASLPIYLTNRTYDGRHHDNVTFEPSLFFRLMPTSSLTMMLNYDYSWAPATLISLVDLPIYTSNIALTRGFGNFDHTMRHMLYANMEYKNVACGFFSTFGYTFMNNRHQRLYSQNVADNVYESFATGQTSNTTSHSINGRISESWNTVVRLITSLSASSSWSNYSMLIGEIPQPFQMLNTSVSANVSCNPYEWLGMSLSSDYHYSRQHNKNGESYEPLRSFSHQARFFLMPGHWQIEWNNEIYHSNDESVSFTYFSDFSLSYRTRSYEIGLLLNNIFGKNEYCRKQISDTQFCYTVTRIRPREVLLKMDFNL